MFFGFLKNKKLSARYRYYKQHMVQYHSWDAYVNLYQDCTARPVVKTDKEICFSPELLFGCSLADVMNAQKKYSYHDDTDTGTLCERLYYKKKIGGYKTRLVLHFYQNRLFFFSYDFSYLLAADRDRIIHIVTDKYQTGDTDIAEKMIVDRSNHGLFIEAGMGLIIHYLALDAFFFQDALEYHQAATRHQQSREKARVRELYERL